MRSIYHGVKLAEEGGASVEMVGGERSHLEGWRRNELDQRRVFLRWKEAFEPALEPITRSPHRRGALAGSTCNYKRDAGGDWFSARVGE